MRWLIEYIRSLFCLHEYKYDEDFVKGVCKDGTRVSVTCTKCGYHKSYWKFM